MLAVGDGSTRIQLLAPLAADSTIAKFLDRSGPGSSRSPTPSTTSRPRRPNCAPRGCACSTTSPGGAPPDAGSTSCTRRTPVGCSSSWSSRRRTPPTEAVQRLTLEVTIKLLMSNIRPTVSAGRPAVGGGTAGGTTVEQIRRPSWPADSAAVAGLPVPDSLSRRSGPGRRGDMFAGLDTRDKDPRKSLHVQEVADPGGRPGRGADRGHGQRHQLQHGVDVDLRAGLHLRLPAPVRAQLRPRPQARPALPRGGLGPVRRRAAGGAGRHPLAARRPGRRALPVGRARGPAGPRRHHARPPAADLGLRDQLRWPRRAGAGEVATS